MSSFSAGDHDKEHERLMRLLSQGLAGSGTWANRPTAPFDGQLYRATDRFSLLFGWDAATSNWYSNQVFSATLLVRDPNSGGGGDLSQASHSFDGKIPYYNLTANGWYLLQLDRSFVFRTAQSAVVFYSCSLTANGRAVSTALTNPTDTKLYTTINQEEPATDTYNAAIPNTRGRLTYAMAVGGGAPGIFFCWVTASYRLIG